MAKDIKFHLFGVGGAGQIYLIMNTKKTQRWFPSEIQKIEKHAKKTKKSFSRVVIESTLEYLGHPVNKDRNWNVGNKKEYTINVPLKD